MRSCLRKKKIIRMSRFKASYRTRWCICCEKQQQDYLVAQLQLQLRFAFSLCFIVWLITQNDKKRQKIIINIFACAYIYFFASFFRLLCFHFNFIWFSHKHFNEFAQCSRNYLESISDTHLNLFKLMSSLSHLACEGSERIYCIRMKSKTS